MRRTASTKKNTPPKTVAINDTEIVINHRIRFRGDRHARIKTAADAINLSFNQFVENISDEAAQIVLDKKRARPSLGEMAADAVLSNSK